MIFFERHLSSGALIASYFAGTEMCMHNIACMTLLLFLLDLFISEIIQLLRHSTTSFAVDVFMNVRIFRQEDLSEQR